MKTPTQNSSWVFDFDRGLGISVIVNYSFVRKLSNISECEDMWPLISNGDIKNIRWTFLGPIKWNQRSHMFKCLYITQLSYKRMFHNCRTSAINLIFAEIRESRKKWRCSNYIRYEIGTTNVPQCWVPVWRDHVIGPKPWNLKMVIIIPQRRGGTWEGVPVAT